MGVAVTDTNNDTDTNADTDADTDIDVQSYVRSALYIRHPHAATARPLFVEF